MPIYEYRCRACGHQIEILQRMGEGADGLACPRCAADALEKRFSTFAAASGGGGNGETARAADGGCGDFACGSGCGAPGGSCDFD
jgi:putative FmdB family regulatory protein